MEFAITNDLGEAQKKPIPYGMYDLKCEVPDFEPFLLKGFKVVRGKVNRVEVQLVWKVDFDNDIVNWRKG